VENVFILLDKWMLDSKEQVRLYIFSLSILAFAEINITPRGSKAER
jgi:hypothetical protein